ncbi:MAG: hypothetical protein II649_06695 [Kiritimatiellae bacterium]|nr:hypothetical protein [Kiritimatiellia bacterium]
MSDEKQETSADVIAEMRKLGELDGKSTDKIPRSLMGLGLRTYADRLEAAATRERLLSKLPENDNSAPVVSTGDNKPGNAAAMREALHSLIDVIERLDGNNPLWWHNNAPGVKALKIAKAALAAPPRNCDVGTAEEQADRFMEFCDDEKGDLQHCRNCRLCNAYDCELAWAQMPYEEGASK